MCLSRGSTFFIIYTYPFFNINPWQYQYIAKEQTVQVKLLHSLHISISCGYALYIRHVISILYLPMNRQIFILKIANGSPDGNKYPLPTDTKNIKSKAELLWIISCTYLNIIVCCNYIFISFSIIKKIIIYNVHTIRNCKLGTFIICFHYQLLYTFKWCKFLYF